jgi:23S rRNA (uracil1939-C5)-methyltransferase
MTETALLKVESLAPGGLGLGRIQGRIIFLPGVLPGETVEVEILTVRSDYSRARPVRVLESHPQRIDPSCPLFMVCGGCHFLHADYDLQMELKAQSVADNLTLSEAAPIVPSPNPFYYRDRVRFHVGSVVGKSRLGFYTAGTNRLIPVEFCYQLNSRINQVLPLLAEWTVRMPSGNSGPTGLNLTIGPEGEGISAVWAFANKPGSEAKRVMADPPTLPIPMVVSHSVRGRIAGKPRPDQAILAYCASGFDYYAYPDTFTQVNVGVNQLMIKAVEESASALQPRRVLDLYSGLGNFSLPLSRIADTVVAVEESPMAVESARMNLKKNQVRNVTLIRRDAEAAVKELVKDGAKFDLVVLDPPRAGAKGLAPLLGRLGPQEILYVSCHAAAMKRDLAECSSLGYSPNSIQAFDMFSQTSHVEVIACLSH